MSPKKRIDQILLERSLFQSRTDAQKAILAGFVKADSRLVLKSSEQFPPEVPIEILRQKRFVSRGGEKLEGALAHFSYSVQGLTAIDVGCSTGGFTDCLLQNGAKRVYGVDVGYGQFAYSLRMDPRVVLMEKVNARYLKKEDFPEPVDLAVIDVSFISLELIIPSVLPLLKEKGDIFALIKPQFEVGKGMVGKGGVVREEALRQEAIEKIRLFSIGQGLEVVGTVVSPLKGPAGNVEYWIYLRKN